MSNKRAIKSPQILWIRENYLPTGDWFPIVALISLQYDARYIAEKFLGEGLKGNQISRLLPYGQFPKGTNPKHHTSTLNKLFINDKRKKS